MIYYTDSSSTNHLNFVVISECLHHDTIAVYLFQKNLIAFLKEQCSTITKIIYFSDGAASQYKNRKNFLNLCNHQADFGIEAEWHFSATSHGKSACHGLGGTVKHLAARASLQHPYEHQIITLFQLYQWAVDNVPGVHFCYCSTEEYEMQKIFLQTRFEQTKTIPGTRKLHSFVPISKDTLRTRIYSSSIITREDRVTKLPGDLELEEISGFVTCSYNSEWWLGCVLETHTEEVQVSLTLLHPPGPSRSYKYPDVPVIVTLPITNILIEVCPHRTGCVYTLIQRDQNYSGQIASVHLPCTTASISPDPLPSHNSYHIKPDSEGSCRPTMENI